MNLLLSMPAVIGISVGAVAAFLLLIFIIWYISAHNKLIRKAAQIDDAFANIDVYLKKRFDLIPNVVETVKGYAKHESETFQRVTEARAMAASATTPEQKAEADKLMSQAVHNFNVVMEKYPELKANSNFMDLQAQLKSVETELASARKYYNATVREFNSAILTIPTSFVARIMKLKAKPYFEAATEERQNVKVSF